MVRLQIAPDIEFKLELEIDSLDSTSRDFDVQQIKTQVYAEFEARLKKVFPEGFDINTFEFGLDKGDHQELKHIHSV